MKNNCFSNESEKTNNKSFGDSPVENNEEIQTISDIDELIFPDDEPYYISQR